MAVTWRHAVGFAAAVVLVVVGVAMVYLPAAFIVAGLTVAAVTVVYPFETREE